MDWFKNTSIHKKRITSLTGCCVLTLVLFSLACSVLQAISAEPPGGPLTQQHPRAKDWAFHPDNHPVDLNWKRQIESNLLWMIDRAENPPRYPNGASLVAVYADAGVWSLGARSVVAALEAREIACEVLDWSRLTPPNLKRFDAVIFPGGFSYFQKLSAGTSGLDAVRKYVANGGRYLGICAGAYLAAKEVHWEGGEFPYPLQLFDGTAQGSIPEIAPWPRAGAAQLKITPAGQKLGLSEANDQRIFYQGGCRFIGGTGITRLANYFDGSPAIIQRAYGPGGEGMVVLSGVHFERPAPGQKSRGPSSPPMLGTVVIPRLLGLTAPPSKTGQVRFAAGKYAPTVTKTTSDEAWMVLKKRLRRRLSQLWANH
jgi:glutamine amidotransferase-like uncharacterized protein